MALTNTEKNEIEILMHLDIEKIKTFLHDLKAQAFSLTNNFLI